MRLVSGVLVRGATGQWYCWSVVLLVSAASESNWSFSNPTGDDKACEREENVNHAAVFNIHNRRMYIGSDLPSLLKATYAKRR